MSKGIVALFSTSGRPVVPFVHMKTGNTFSMPYVTTGPSVNSSALAGVNPLTAAADDETRPGSVTADESRGQLGGGGGGHLSLHVRPLMHAAMLAVIHRHRWSVVYYLYDSDHGMYDALSLMSELHHCEQTETKTEHIRLS